MKKIYKIREYDKSIQEVDFIKETNCFYFYKCPVTTSERRVSKGYAFSTWDDAKLYLLKLAEYELNQARLNLARKQGEYGNIKGLKNPRTKAG